MLIKRKVRIIDNLIEGFEKTPDFLHGSPWDKALLINIICDNSPNPFYLRSV